MPSIRKTILEFGGGSETKDFLPLHSTPPIIRGVNSRRRKCMALPLLKLPSKLRADLKDGNTDIIYKTCTFLLDAKFTYRPVTRQDADCTLSGSITSFHIIAYFTTIIINVFLLSTQLTCPTVPLMSVLKERWTHTQVLTCVRPVHSSHKIVVL